MLGDMNISEPGSLIGFAGPRVVKETIGKDLPKGFQTAEFVLEHGFLDFIVDRRELKTRLSLVLKLLKN
jgi:acetyl-CoA carboxylase carboxyl transferase subunit beta